MRNQTVITVTAIVVALFAMSFIDTRGYVDTKGYGERSHAEPDEKAISLVKAALKLVDQGPHKTERIYAEGTLLGNNQGTNPQQPTRSRPFSAEWKIDFEKHRFLQRTSSYLDKELLWCAELIVAREMIYSLLCHSNAFTKDGPRQTDDIWTNRMDTLYPDPQWHLAHALNQSPALKWEGQSMAGGQPEDVISYTDEFRRRHLLFLNSKTHLLREVSTTAQLTRFEEGFVPKIIFEDYRPIGHYRNPTKVTIVQASWTVFTNNLRTIRREFDRALSDADFAPPAGSVEMDKKRSDFNVSEVAKSVYFVESASFDYNSMFVVFADYVLVVEAPSSDDASTKVMAAVREVAPGKPIRYIVPTHFHEDHIGGLRAYLRAGATVVTTPGNLQFMEMFMRKLKAREPQIKLPAVEVIADKRRFSDGTITLDLFNVPNAHVDEMVVPFIPADGIAYVADGFTRDFGPWRPITIEERTLIDRFKQLGLNMRMVLPGHGPLASQADLERYLSSDRPAMRLAP